MNISKVEEDKKIWAIHNTSLNLDTSLYYGIMGDKAVLRALAKNSS